MFFFSHFFFLVDCFLGEITKKQRVRKEGTRSRTRRATATLSVVSASWTCVAFTVGVAPPWSSRQSRGRETTGGKSTSTRPTASSSATAKPAGVVRRLSSRLAVGSLFDIRSYVFECLVRTRDRYIWLIVRFSIERAGTNLRVFFQSGLHGFFISEFNISQFGFIREGVRQVDSCDLFDMIWEVIIWIRESGERKKK